MPITNCLHSPTAMPPWSSLESFFDGVSPSFSQLLAEEDDGDGDGDVGGSYTVKDSPFFTVPPGLSPSVFLNSHQLGELRGLWILRVYTLLLIRLTFIVGPLGMSHQQALVKVTTQVALEQSHMQMQANDTLNDANSKQKVAPSVLEVSEISHADKKYQVPSSMALDKPSDDGYNWRKYGQKQVKGSEFPRSYYKCTHLNCQVKKKVERTSDGHITEIIYKGQHRHEKPLANRRVKDNNYDSNENASIHHSKSESNSQQGYWVGNSNKLGGERCADYSVPSDSEDMGNEDIREEEGDESEPNPKRRRTDVGFSEVPLPYKTVTEPKIIVQTRSEVDILDDGYRWRKYGQKVVKGSPHPRSYYKCTSAGCTVRKHVERASMDPKAVITTYEGKHNHDVPAARNSSHNVATINSMPLKSHKGVPQKHPLLKDMDFGNNDQRLVCRVVGENAVSMHGINCGAKIS
ncbi:hypothetical protein VNO77_35277 [Canavalia gladiata]|uniref:WRKY domain-containing protein n=1 Tax=Canavalia gladiata TaxID=3824 RepID=A0AAN9Q083_CANGL